jgi:RNA polymerase sigma factor (TIGR02999 family)
VTPSQGPGTPSHAPIGELIVAADAGDALKAGELFAALYRELHGIAGRELHLRGRDLTLSPTTLLHEAYLDLAARDGVRFPDKERFLAYASRVMRGLLIDYVRRRRAVKRGGEFQLTTLEEDAPTVIPDAEPLERLSGALDALAQVDARLANVVDLHFFCGFSLVDIAQLRGVSDRTVQSDWRKARLLLQREMEERPGR